MFSFCWCCNHILWFLKYLQRWKWSLCLTPWCLDCQHTRKNLLGIICEPKPCFHHFLTLLFLRFNSVCRIVCFLWYPTAKCPLYPLSIHVLRIHISWWWYFWTRKRFYDPAVRIGWSDWMGLSRDLLLLLFHNLFKSDFIFVPLTGNSWIGLLMVKWTC